LRILIDTNILFSSILFPSSKIAQTLLYILEHHKIVLCDQNIFELREVTKRKQPEKLTDVETLLTKLSYELIPVTHQTGKIIRDVKDQPILNAAITEDVDIILTGDKDFLSLEMERPKCMNVANFLEYEGIEF